MEGSCLNRRCDSITEYIARIGDIVYGKPPTKLKAIALGSCIGLVIYDPTVRIASLGHILLPEKKEFSKEGKPAKFGNIAVKSLINQVILAGGRKLFLLAKMAGGAKMFEFKQSEKFLDVGQKNIESINKCLADNNIRLVSQDVGGSIGRTIIFDTSTLILTIKETNNKDIKMI